MQSKTFYGFYDVTSRNPSAAADVTWYSSPAARDEAMKHTRKWMVKRGLSKYVAVSQIYPVRKTVITYDRIRDFERYQLADHVG